MGPGQILSIEQKSIFVKLSTTRICMYADVEEQHVLRLLLFVNLSPVGRMLIQLLKVENSQNLAPKSITWLVASVF